MIQITQKFFVAKNFQAVIVAKTKGYFCTIRKSYVTIDSNSFLVLKYIKSVNNIIESNELWFSFQQLYHLLHSLKKFATLLEKKQDDIFFLEENSLGISIEYKSFTSEVKAIKDSLQISFGIGENEYTNTEDIGVHLAIKDIHSKSFLDIDTFLSFVYYLQKLDLLVVSQNMITMYLIQKYSFKSNTVNFNEIQEETVDE